MEWKRVFRPLAIVTCALVLVGCQTGPESPKYVTTEKASLTYDQKANWNLMIGTWYGNQPVKSGGVRQHIMTRNPDGTYFVRARHVTSSGINPMQAEAGVWGIVGPVYFSIFRGWLEGETIYPSDPQDPYNYDAYEVIMLSPEIFRYKSYSSGTVFEVLRVDEDFEFPEVDP